MYRAKDIITRQDQTTYKSFPSMHFPVIFTKGIHLHTLHHEGLYDSRCNTVATGNCTKSSSKTNSWYGKLPCRYNSLSRIWISADKHNDRTIAAYLKKRYENRRSRTTDFGDWFVMNDHVFQLNTCVQDQASVIHKKVCFRTINHTPYGNKRTHIPHTTAKKL